MAATNNAHTGAPQDTLLALHQRLDDHFTELSAARRRSSPTIPTFALEHGLSKSELEVLKTEVRSAVRRGLLPRDMWLPFVIYAAEIGYEYSGDEYWQTFESRTPGWVTNGDRDYIRRVFRKFKENFGGASPAGRWAEQFSIICWPITHAVLPTDLQRHLARLLFEYRTALTAALLADPAELGKRLAARSWQSSSRFQVFAQNSNLLGQVAVALLVEGDEQSPYLVASTLHRIVEDLSKESEAKRWLQGAKSAATRVQRRGLQPPGGSDGPTKSTRRVPRPASSTDPELSLRKEAGLWATYLELTDLSVLAERLPSVHSELGRLRANVAGVDGPPLARGRLLYPGQKLRLAHWPEPPTPLISVENGSAPVNALLAQQCVLSPGPVWLFRVRESAFATEVRGKFVRPAHRYVLLAKDVLSVELPVWIALSKSATTGIVAYEISVPQVLASNDLAILQGIGIGAVVDLRIRPAGLVPAVWDGEGTTEWVAGDIPVLGVSSTRRASHCLLTLDHEEHLIRWPASEDEIFVRFEDPGVGAHALHIEVIPADVDQPSAEGWFALSIRPPLNRPLSGTLREGVVIMATPVSPTLRELWDGSAVLAIRGPADVPATIQLCLADQSAKVLARRTVETTLPLEEDSWRDLFTTHFRHVEEVHRRYDEAESCLVSVSAPGIGTVSLRADREFSAFRWAAGRDEDGPFVRLIDNTEGQRPEIAHSEFATPGVCTALAADAESRVRRHDGGLVLARRGAEQVAVILPPTVRTFIDLRRLEPHLTEPPRTYAGIRSLVDLATLWAMASLPADPFGENRRDAVLRAITSIICGLIGGDRWRRIERLIAADGANLTRSDLGNEIGDRPFHRALAADLVRYVDAFGLLKPEKRARPLAIALATHSRESWIRASNTRFAEFLLRLASEPSSLVDWPVPEVQAGVQRALELPVLLRAARFVVLATQMGAADDARYVGWVWQ